MMLLVECAYVDNKRVNTCVILRSPFQSFVHVEYQLFEEAIPDLIKKHNGGRLFSQKTKIVELTTLIRMLFSPQICKGEWQNTWSTILCGVKIRPHGGFRQDVLFTQMDGNRINLHCRLVLPIFKVIREIPR